MKFKLLGLISFITLISIPTLGQKMVLEGFYTGENIYIQNPFTSSGVGFCSDSVYVNGTRTTDSVHSSAYKIDLEVLDLKVGDSLKIVIFHKADCLPKVLTSTASPPSIIIFEKTYVDSNGTLTWKTKREYNKVAFIIEQKKWGKWVKTGESIGIGNMNGHEYNYQVDLHNGLNCFRVKSVLRDGYAKFSPEAKIKSNKPKVDISINNEQETINFSDSTHYEVYNYKGNLIRNGYGDKIDISRYQKKIHYINYDNSTKEMYYKKNEKFIIKK